MFYLFPNLNLNGKRYQKIPQIIKNEREFNIPSIPEMV
jgi:hypothetical protein